ncbi:MAG: membrane protein insertase YidC [Flavobacteriales bacterium]|nr:membrane protein insertase YidC [Flavobacteriales bacterium]
MDKNQIIGVVLIVVLMAGFYFLNSPDESTTPPQTEQAQVVEAEKPAQEAAQPETIVAASQDSAQLALMDAVMAEKYGIFGPSANGEEQIVVLENNKIKAELSTKGGWFHQATLVDGYKTYWDSIPIQLWDKDKSEMYMSFVQLGKGIHKTSEFYFQPSSQHVTVSGDQPGILTMRLNTSNPSRYLEMTYSLAPDSYEVVTSVNFVGLEQFVDLSSDTPLFTWEALGLRHEKGITEEQRHSSVFFREMGEDRDYLRESTEDDDEIEGSLNWMAFKQNYFTAAVISDDGFKGGSKVYSNKADAADTLHTTEYRAELPLDLKASGNSSTSLRFYFGPNDYNELTALNVDEFGRIIDYGWWIFGWVNRNMIRPVFNFFSNYISSAGVVIILLTILIKLLLFPITWKNFLSGAKMRVLKPQIDEINKKYEGKDAMEKQQAVMTLYRETGVNMFAGCLPSLLQMPILYAMFRFFPASIELRGRGFLWADDLGAYDAIVSWSTEIPFLSSIYGNHISGFTVLMAISTFFYTRLSTASMPTQSQPGMPNMKVIMNIFPFIMLVFFNKFASGLSFYYLIANLMSIGQMIVIKKYFIDEEKILAKLEANKAKPKKKGGFAQRLEEMQRIQQEQNKRKK